MGIVFKGIPERMALDLAQRHNIRRFFETGTHVARTAMWARQHFDLVITIESHSGYFQKNIQRYPNTDVIFIFGRSEERMPEFVNLMQEPHLFWLDAHWGADLPYRRPGVVCPVIQEIEIINTNDQPHVILVDDARLFTGKDGWPAAAVVMRFLERGGTRSVYIQDDVIVAVPK